MRIRQFKSGPRNHFVIHKGGTRIPAFRNAASKFRALWTRFLWHALNSRAHRD
jgi:hypothetical protein